MMTIDKWKQTNLGEQVNLLTGFPFKSAEYTEDANGIPLVRGDNVVQGTFRWDDVKRWSRDQVENISDYFLNPGDVVLAMDRPWIEAGLKYACVSAHDVPCLLVQRVSRLRAKDTLDQKFLRYVIGSPEFTNYVLGVQTGTAVPHISGNQIKQYQFLLPSLPEQRDIAWILGGLDDKIELNRRMNRTLEHMARAMFRQWFVENEEVEGWEVEKFNEISEISRDSVNPSQFPDEPFNHYSIPAYDDTHFPMKELGNQIKSNKFVVSDKCVLISKLNPEIQRIWLPFELQGRSICSTEFLVNTPKGYFTPEFLFGLFYSRSFQDRFTSMTTGTSGSHQRVKAEYVLDMDIQLPPEKLVLKYSETTQPLLQRIQQNILESRTLAMLRDTLLPKLMRGEVRVQNF